MNYSPLDYLALFTITSLVVGFLTPRFRRLALRKKIFDVPNSQHKTHIEPVPYLGGLSIISGTLLVSLTAAYFTNPDLMGVAFGILLPPLFLGAIGLIDDIVNLNALPRFVAQTAAGIGAAVMLILTNTFGSPTGFKSLDVFITILFIVVLSNSINFFDNLDGGASGTVAISSAFLAFLSFSNGQQYLAALSIVLSGSTTGFLWWNKSPARIYMGDAGSLFLGSLLASLLVRFDPKPTNFPNYFVVTLLLVAVPLLDTCTVITSRIVKGNSPFRGGRDHLSHRLIRRGFSKFTAVITLWSLTLFFAISAVVLSQFTAQFGLVFSLIMFGVWFVLYLLAVIFME